MLIIDAHEDIAWNMLTFGRDYTSSVSAVRQKEAKTQTPAFNGNTLLSLEEWLTGKVAVIFATLYVSPEKHRMGAWDTQAYGNADEAYAIAGKQLDIYRRLTDEHERFSLIGTQTDLENVLNRWEEWERNQDDPDAADTRQIGIIPLMEGADPIREPEEAEEWYERGLRIVGLSWEDTRYAGGTHVPGPVTSEGMRLLEVMADIGMILDLSHLSEEAYYQAIERYEGTIIASHANPRRFLPSARGLSDDMIRVLAERDGVIGIVPYCRFLKPGWQPGDPREEVTLQTVADAVDHVCQLTGDARHVGIGTDFDGGFGVERVPSDIDTIADLQKLIQPLAERGYTQDQVEAIFNGNWRRVLQSGLPE